MTDTNVSACSKTASSPSPDGAPSPGKPRRFSRKPSPQAISIYEAGDVNAGVLLHQLKYRFKMDDTLLEFAGRRWVAQTGECWCEEAGLTAKQYKRALGILKDRKLVEVRHHKVRPHHRWRTTFIRLPTAEAGSATSLGAAQCGPTKDHTDVVPQGAVHSGPDGDLPTAVPGGTPNKENYLPGEVQEGNFVPEAQKAFNSSDEKNGQGKGSNKQVSKKAIERVWLDAHANAYPETEVTPFAGSDWNSAKMLVEKLGDDAPAVVEAAVRRWDSFLDALLAARGLYKQGNRPSLFKLSSNADVALNWWKDGAMGPDIDEEEEWKCEVY